MIARGFYIASSQVVICLLLAATSQINEHRGGAALGDLLIADASQESSLPLTSDVREARLTPARLQR